MEARDVERVTLVVFGLLVPAALGSSLTIFNDGDVRWHIAAGQWMLDHRAVPRTDPFSFTAYGRPWTAIEWGAELIYGFAHARAGFAGVAAVVTAALVALHLTILAEARRWVAPLGLAILVILLNLILIPMILARPHLLGWVVLAVWLLILLRARDRRRTPPLIAAALMIIWANLHGSFLIGLAIAAAVALDACLEARWDRKLVLGWILFGLASLLSSLITPHGIATFGHAMAITRMEVLPLIVEWRPSNFGRTPWFFVALALAAALMAWRGVRRLRPVMAGLLALLLLLALLQMRHQAIVAIVAAMLLPRAMANRVEPRPPLFTDRRRRGMALLLGAGAVTGLLAFRAFTPLEPAENGANPKSAIAALPVELRGAPGLNGYGFGGPLILAGIRPYIDGRADMYGDAFTLDYQAIVDGDRGAFDRAARRYSLQWTMLPPRYSALVARLDSDPHWKRIHGDRTAVIHRRR